ncbi:unnamed protein product, partial [Ixodes pacificus]
VCVREGRSTRGPKASQRREGGRHSRRRVSSLADEAGSWRCPFFFQPGAPGKRRPVSPSDIGMQPCSSERRRVGAAPRRWATWFRASASSSSSTERGLPAARTEWTPTQNGRGGRRTVGRLRERRRR